MRNRNIMWLVALLIVATLLAACDNTGGGGGGGGGALELSQSFSADDGSITFKYPSGWVARGDTGTAEIGTSQDVLDGDATEPAAGQFRAQVLVAPVDMMPGLSAESTPAEVMAVFAEFMTAGEDAPSFGATTELTIGSRAAARMEGSDDKVDAVIYVVNLGEGNFAVVAGGSAKGELGNFDATLKAIIESMTAA